MNNLQKLRDWGQVHQMEILIKLTWTTIVQTIDNKWMIHTESFSSQLFAIWKVIVKDWEWWSDSIFFNV